MSSIRCDFCPRNDWIDDGAEYVSIPIKLNEENDIYPELTRNVVGEMIMCMNCFKRFVDVIQNK